MAMNAACVDCHESSALPDWDPHADTVACASCHLPHDSPGVNTLLSGVDAPEEHRRVAAIPGMDDAWLARAIECGHAAAFAGGR